MQEKRYTTGKILGKVVFKGCKVRARAGDGGCAFEERMLLTSFRMRGRSFLDLVRNCCSLEFASRLLLCLVIPWGDDLAT